MDRNKKSTEQEVLAAIRTTLFDPRAPRGPRWLVIGIAVAVVILLVALITFVSSVR